MPANSKIDKALSYASIKHKGQYRKILKHPYIFHPLEVMSITAMMSEDDDVLCAALLHDTIEDTNVTIEELRRLFGDRVAELVASESENKRIRRPKSETWKTRKTETIKRIQKSTDLDEKRICLADKLSNLRSIHMAYLMVGDEMWESFNQKDPKEHAWYYASLRKVLKDDLGEEGPFLEFDFLVDVVFKKYIGGK